MCIKAPCNEVDPCVNILIYTCIHILNTCTYYILVINSTSAGYNCLMFEMTLTELLSAMIEMNLTLCRLEILNIIKILKNFTHHTFQYS